MTNSALFTEIADFPTGFGTALEVIVGTTSLGTHGPGDSVDFSGYSGGGVSEFVISGISPAADLTSAEGFPLQLVFDTAAAEFTMASPALAAVPMMGWPGLLTVGGLALLAGTRALRRYGRRSA
jgi:hypothetical protein